MADFVLQITGKLSSYEGVLRGLTETASVNRVVGKVLDTVADTLLGLPCLRTPRFSISLRNMSSPPDLKPSDLIEITGSHPIPAIVASVALEGAYEVVYLDESGKAVAEEVQWVDGVWQFLHLTPRRVDAEDLERLQPFVKQLRGTAQS